MSSLDQETKLSHIENLDKNHVFGTWSKQRDVVPKEVIATNGNRFTTVTGDEYLDFSSQLVCSNLGFDGERIVQAMTDQAKRVPYVKPSYTTEPRAKLAEKLKEITPGNLTKTFFTTGGAEANEAAIKMARLYTGKYKILSRYRSYHGATFGAISATGDPRRWSAEPGVPGMIKAPDPYEYGSSIGPEKSLEYIDEMLMLEGDTVAAVLVEPIVGSNGVLVPPDDYLPRLKQIAHDHDALLICDEVMVGMGRTGEWFACDHFDVVPDIMTVAKGLTGAFAPLGAAVVSDEVAEFFDDVTLVHGHTFYGHPIACAAGLAAIETYQSEGLIEKSKLRGRYLEEKIDGLRDKHPSIGDVRGLGLYHGIELTKSSHGREPFVGRESKISGEKSVVDDVAKSAYENGVYIYSSMNTLMLTPPLTISESEIDEAIDALDQALTIADEAMIN